MKQKLAKASTTYGCAVVIANQMATKILTAENKPANFDTGDKAVMMPQLGGSGVQRIGRRAVIDDWRSQAIRGCPQRRSKWSSFVQAEALAKGEQSVR